MNAMLPPSLSPALAAWIVQIRARAWAEPLLLLLDAFAPLSILGAQALYVTAPLTNLFYPSGMRPPLAELAALLETPGGTACLRDQLLPDPPASAAPHTPVSSPNEGTL